MLFVNRIALNAQQRKIYKRNIKQNRPDLSLYDCEFDSPFDFKNPFEYGNIIILSYQSALKHLSDAHMTPAFNEKLKNVEYVVFDECDFFVSDAFFNSNTDRILRKLLNISRNAKRIYMSATMNHIFKTLYNKEKELYESIPHYYVPEKFKAYYYYLPKNYNKYNIYFFDKWQDITDLIYKNTDQKYLCFVKRSLDGSTEARKLNFSWKNTNNKATFIDSSSKYSTSSETFKSIIAKETFDENVVFATKVLDRGINICTEGPQKITNVVIDSFFDESDITQMIGRLRNSNSTINVYIKTTTSADVNREIQSLREKRNLIKAFRSIDSLEKQIDLLHTKKLPWYFTEDRYPQINQMFEYIIRRKLDLLCMYKDAIENKNKNITFPFSAKKYSKFCSDSPTATPLKDNSRNPILLLYAEDLSHLNSYDELVASWFGKKAPVKYKEQDKEAKEKWIKFLGSIAIKRHEKGNLSKEKYYTPLYREKKCAFASDTNLLQLTKKYFSNSLPLIDITRIKALNNDGSFFKYIKERIVSFDLPFEVVTDKTFILDENNKPTSTSRKHLKFVTLKTTTTTEKE